MVATDPRRSSATAVRVFLLLQDRDRGRSRRARRLMQRRGWKVDVEEGREGEKSVKKDSITCLHEGISYARHHGLKKNQPFISIQFRFCLSKTESQAEVAVKEIPVAPNWPHNILSSIVTINSYRNSPKPGTNLVSKHSDSDVSNPHCKGYNWFLSRLDTFIRIALLKVTNQVMFTVSNTVKKWILIYPYKR